jgi:hypothetical protein
MQTFVFTLSKSTFSTTTSTLALVNNKKEIPFETGKSRKRKFIEDPMLNSVMTQYKECILRIQQDVTQIQDDTETLLKAYNITEYQHVNLTEDTINTES